MTDYQTLKKIFYLSIVTLNKNKAHINYIEVDYNLISFLTLLNILELESGNFETHDNHYRLNEKYIKINNKIIHVSIKDIESDFERCDDNLYYKYSDSEVKSAKYIKEVFYKLKNNLQRKAKLEKLNYLR